MKISGLKHKIKLLELEHKYQLDVLREKQIDEREQLLNQCIHKYDDDTSAGTWIGSNQGYEICDICGKNL